MLCVLAVCVCLGTISSAQTEATSNEDLTQVTVEAQLCLAEARHFMQAQDYLAAAERCERVASVAGSLSIDDRLRDFVEQAAVLKASALKLHEATKSPGVAPEANRARLSKQPTAEEVAAAEKRIFDEIMGQIAKDAIPQTELLRQREYPRSISDVRTLPDSVTDDEVSKIEPWRIRIDGALERRISATFRDTPFTEVVDYLREVSGVNLVTDPETLATAKPLTLKLKSAVRLRAALDWIMEIEGLSYDIRDEAIFISSSERIAGPAVTKVYDISYLTLGATLSEFDQNLNKANELQEQSDRHESAVASAETEGESWVDLIRHTIHPDTWSSEEDGRGLNTISYRAGKLVVTNTEAVHKKVVELLNRFREARAAMVSIQTRFIMISDDYLERIGVDWGGLGTPDVVPEDYPIPTDVDDWGTRVSPSEKDTAGTSIDGERIPGGFRSDPSSVHKTDPDSAPGDTYEWVPFQGTVENILEIPMGGSSGMKNSGGFFLNWVLLKNYQVSGLLDAVHKEGMGTQLSAPRITCFNTQRSNITIANLVRYIQRISSDQVPSIGTIVDGIILEVQPFVSADRRFVTVEVRPAVNEIVEIRDFSYKIETQADQDIEKGEGAPAEVQLPHVSRRGVSTTVSIPDGGTVMIGGLSSANLSEGESSVPFLGQLPIVNVLFKREGVSESKSSLVILLSADVIQQD